MHDNTTEIAIIENLYSSNMARNPFFKGGSQGIVVNNYIYNPGRDAVHYNLSPEEWEGHTWVTGKMSVVGNVFEYGKDYQKGIKTAWFRGPVEVFWNDNLVINGDEELSGSHTLVDKKPVWPVNFSSKLPNEVKSLILKNAGSRPWSRNAVDERIIDQVKTGTHRIIDGENEVGGYPVIQPVYQTFNENEWDLNTMKRK